MRYNDYIKELNPKPILNLKWYKGEDRYTDGDIEDAIIGLIAGNAPDEYSESIAQYPNWAIFYHLSHVRRNLLAWYPFQKDANVLEIGCGFGAITSFLCEKCASVTTVELSQRRAAGTLLRCREKDNLEIIVGNLNDIEFESRYDYITLIGVLEYQGAYTDSEHPYLDFLKKIRSLLKPGGKLLIAIENQYGLKYWCGKAEDHTGIPYDGIRQYPEYKGVRTFSKKTLEKLIKESGFSNTYFYYPQPDYKLPDAIFSEDYIPATLAGTDISFYYLQDRKTITADERVLYPELVDNGVFEFFANSFLVECADTSEIEKRVIYAKCNTMRNDDYRMMTIIYKDGIVEKRPLVQRGMAHLLEIDAEHKRLAGKGVKVLEYDLSEDGEGLLTDYCDKVLLEDYLTELCEARDIAGIYKVYDKIYDDIRRSSKHTDENNLMIELGLIDEKSSIDFPEVCEKVSVDMVPRNAFLSGDELLWFDQEWVLENVPAEFALYRAIVNFFDWQDANGYIITAESILQHYGVSREKREKYYQLNQFLFQMIMDVNYKKVRMML